MLAADLELIHHCLGLACEAMCHTHVQHSQLYSNALKTHLCSSHLSQPCHVHLVNRLRCLIKRRQLCLRRMQSTVEVPSIGGALYMLAVTDVSTRYHWTTPLRLKSDAMEKLCHIILSVPETHCPLTLRTDGGGEFFNACLGLWLNEQGILHPPAPPYTSEYNGLSEHFLHTLMARVKCCLISTGLPDKY